jgi:hypothetical protein
MAMEFEFPHGQPHIEISRRPQNTEISPEILQLQEDHPELEGVFRRNPQVKDLFGIYYREKEAMGIIPAYEKILRGPLRRDADKNPGRQYLEDCVTALEAAVDEALKHPEGKTPEELEELRKRQTNLALTMPTFDADMAKPKGEREPVTQPKQKQVRPQ